MTEDTDRRADNSLGGGREGEEMEGGRKGKREGGEREEREGGEGGERGR